MRAAFKGEPPTIAAQERKVKRARPS